METDKIIQTENPEETGIQEELDTGNRKKQEDIDKCQGLGCSYLYFGKNPVEQECYYCLECDAFRVKGMCKYCFFICHQKCYYSSLRYSEEKPFSFVCACGEDFDHIKKAQKRQDRESRCNMRENFDLIFMEGQESCKCGEHGNIPICSICYYECHAYCSNSTPPKDSCIDSCKCTHSNHSQYKHYAPTSSIQQFIDKALHKFSSYLSPPQVLNLLFSPHQFPLDYPQNSDAQRSRTLLNIHLFSETFRYGFKAYYFGEKIIHEMFSLDQLFQLCRELKDVKGQKNMEKLHLFNLFFFIHLKNDFKFMKSYTTSDFLFHSVFERLEHRKYILSNNPYTQDFYRKYPQCKEFFFKQIFSYITDNVELTKINFGDEWTKCYEDFLKIICFMLKRLFFTKEELKIIIDQLEPFYQKLFDFLDNPQLQEERLLQVWSLVLLFVKLFLLISVTYNDFAFEKFIEQSQAMHSAREKKIYFIHSTESKIGKKLFQMIIQNCQLLSIYYKNPNAEYGDETNKVSHSSNSVSHKLSTFRKKMKYCLNISNETLKLFSVVDNSYYNQILETNENDLQAYMQSIQRFSSTPRARPAMDGLQYIKEMKFRIESFFQYFFTSTSLNEYYTKDKHTDKRTLNWDAVISHLQISELRSTIYHVLTERPRNECDILSMQSFFNAIKRSKMVDTFIEEFIFTNFDETISKLFVYFNKQQLMKENNGLQHILSLLLIYSLSRRGIKYLQTGKTLARINNVLKLYWKKESSISEHEEGDEDKTGGSEEEEIHANEKEIHMILQFLRIFTKMLKYHDVYLYKNKNLTKITNNLILYLKSIEEQNVITFAEKLNIALIFNIFSYMSSNYCFEDFDHIKLSVLKFCSRMKILTTPLVRIDRRLDLVSRRHAFSINPGASFQNASPSNIKNDETKFTCCGICRTNDPQIQAAEATKKIYYAICHLISQNTYCYYKRDEKFFDCLKSAAFTEFFEEALLSDRICFKHRRNLLRFIRTIYFIERINPIDYEQRERYFTYQDYEKYVFFLKKYPENNSLQEKLPALSIKEEKVPNEEDFKHILNKKKIAEKIIDLLWIFQREIDNFNGKQFDGDGGKYSLSYIREIVLSIQFFSDFLNLEDSLCNFLMPPFHDLIETFIFNSNVIIGEYLRIMKIDKFQENEYIHKIFKQKWIEQNNQEKNKTAYNIISECLAQIYKITNMSKFFSLSHFTKIYDKTVELDFSSFALIPFKDYEYFYEENDQQDIENFHYFLRKDYESQFNNVDQTNFLAVLGSQSKEFQIHDYLQFFINYFVAYLQSKESFHHLCHYECLIYIATKMLYYDTNISRKKLDSLSNGEIEVLTGRMKNLIKENIVHALLLAKNNFIHSKLLRMTNVTKLTFEFLQLIISTKIERRIFELPYQSENKVDYFKENQIQFKTYKSINVKSLEQIFYDEETNGAISVKNKMASNKNSIFDIILSTFKYSYCLLDLRKQLIYEMPFDELIVLLTNVITTFIVYIESTDNEVQDRVFLCMKDIYHSGIFKCIYIQPEKSEVKKLRKKVLLYVKLQVLNLLISYLRGGDDKRKKEMVKKLLKDFAPHELYEEIYRNFIDLLEEYPNIPNPLYTLVEDITFRRELEIQYAFDDNFREALQLKACFKLFTVIKILEDDYLIIPLKQKYSDVKASRKSREEDVKFKLYQFLSKMVVKVDIQKADNANSGTENQCQVTYFIRPYLTFFLSSQAKWQFIEEVDRKNATSKLNALISMSDQFMLEMVYNSKLLRNKKWKYKLFINLNMYYLHLINYLFTIIHNILLIDFYYRDPNMDQQSYEAEVTPDKYPYRNYWLGVAQAGFILLIFALSSMTAPLSIYLQLMKTYHCNFLVKKKADKGRTVVPITIRTYFKDKSSVPGNDLTWFQYTRVAIEGFLYQGKTIIFLITVILLVVFYATRHPIWIVIPIVFVMSVSRSLYNILLSVQLRWWQLLTLLLFTYMCIYIFMWLGMFFFGEILSMEATEINSGENINETFCQSTVQCLLFMIDSGIRNSGGIGDALPKVSYRYNINYFIKRFFYVMLFHIIIILVLGSVFLGIIVDTFANLRDKYQKKQEDMHNKCFICQITRDQSLMRSIDFDKHLQENHNMWNYIYFLTYLHIGNPHEFSSLEEYVWEKLGNQDITWIPLEKSKGDDS